MKFRITQVQNLHTIQTTKVAVDLLEQLGQITRVKERLSFDIQGIYEGEPLDAKVSEFLVENGFAVPTATE